MGISAMADSEFIDCSATLGGITRFTPEQKARLAELAGRSSVWGGHAGWMSDDLLTAGVILQGLSAASIAQLNIDSLDVLSAMGEKAGWENDQLIGGFGRFKALAKSGSVTGIDGSELSAMGEFACGASATEIGAMPSAAYGDAALDIGKLTMCDTARKEAFADHFLSVYGSNETAWSEAEVGVLGTMVGGLSEA